MIVFSGINKEKHVIVEVWRKMVYYPIFDSSKGIKVPWSLVE